MLGFAQVGETQLAEVLSAFPALTNTRPQLPALAGLGWSIKRSANWNTTKVYNVSSKEVSKTRWSYPQYAWELVYNVLRQKVITVTLDPRATSTGATLSGGNLSLTSGSGNNTWYFSRATQPILANQRRIFSSVVNTDVTDKNAIGFATPRFAIDPTTSLYLGSNTFGVGIFCSASGDTTTAKYNAGAIGPRYDFLQGDVVDVAIDTVLNFFWWRVNGGPWTNSGNPDSGVGGIALPITPPFFPVVSTFKPSKVTATFSRFAYAPPSTFTSIGVDATQSEMQTLMGFFNQMQGDNLTFLYQDQDDNSVTQQVIGVGDGTTTAFVLKRAFGTAPLEPVLAPNTEASLSVYLNGALQGAGSYYITPWKTTDGHGPGYLVFGTPPGLNVAISISMSYYWPCRFVLDQCDFIKLMSGYYEMKKLVFKSIK